MAQVNATIAGRQFRLACEDGQEEHLLALATISTSASSICARNSARSAIRG